jgi:hypothetical protein
MGLKRVYKSLLNPKEVSKIWEVGEIAGVTCVFLSAIRKLKEEEREGENYVLSRVNQNRCEGHLISSGTSTFAK